MAKKRAVTKSEPLNSHLSVTVLSALPVFSGCATVQRKLLFYPTHGTQTNGLTEWKHEGALIGYSRLVADPENVCF